MRPFQFTPEQEAWLRDLETTTVRQARGVLHAGPGSACGEGFCCLGRACVTLNIPPTEPTYASPTLIPYDGETTVLSPALRDRLHLYSQNGSPFVGSDATPLTEMNDNGVPFKDIAAALRADPWAYFARDARGAECDA